MARIKIRKNERQQDDKKSDGWRNDGSWDRHMYVCAFGMHISHLKIAFAINSMNMNVFMHRSMCKRSFQNSRISLIIMQGKYSETYRIYSLIMLSFLTCQWLFHSLWVTCLSQSLFHHFLAVRLYFSGFLSSERSSSSSVFFLSIFPFSLTALILYLVFLLIQRPSCSKAVRINNFFFHSCMGAVIVNSSHFIFVMYQTRKQQTTFFRIPI